MDDAEFLAERFEAHRPHLRVVAYRMLGSAHEADDAVQEASGAGRQREVVAAFLAASRGGDFEALLTLLDPEVVLRADPAAIARLDVVLDWRQQ